MNVILQHIDSFSALSPILPPILKAGLIVLVCLVAYLPLSLLAWVISLSFGKAITLLEEALSRLSEKALRLSLRLKLRAKNVLEQHYKLSSSYVSFEDIKYQFSGHSVQEALNAFTDTLQSAPTMATDREAQKTKLVEQVNMNLEGLSGGISSLKNIDIPELELDKGQVIRKKSALSSLFLFIPLLFAVVLVNTSLLNTFFDELMGGREIFDNLPYSIVIALMFTFIELGAGVAIGFQEREKEGLTFSSGNYILSAFCWFIVSGLAFVEFFLYLLVGTSEEYDRDEIIELFMAGDFAEILFAGGWLSILGPSIVFALYVFGHRVSTGYFDYSKENDFERFKNDLDDRFNLYQSMKSGIDDISDKISDLVKSIKKENIELNKVDTDSSVTIDNLQKVLENQRKAINDAVAEAEKLEIPRPEIQVQKLSIEDSKSFHRANLVYLLVLLSSISVATISLPNEIAIGTFVTSGLVGSFLVAMLFISLSILAGMLLSTRVTLVSTHDGHLGKVILEKTSVVSLTAAMGIFIVNIALIYFIFHQSGLATNIIPFIFCLLSFAGAFFSGRRLLQAIGSWYVTTMSIWLATKSTASILVSLIAIILARIVAILIPILDSLSYPIRFVLRRN